MNYTADTRKLLIFGSFTIRDWDLSRQRQQTMVDLLVKEFSVFYVERINPNTVGIKTIVKACIKRFIAVRHMKNKPCKKERIFFIQLTVFPFQKGIFRILNAVLALFQIRKIMKKHQIQSFDSIIISHPANYVNDIFLKIPAKKRIYDCFQRFEFNKNFPVEMGDNDKSIAKTADLVVADSITIFNEKKRQNANVIRIPQGIDLDNYNDERIRNAAIPDDLKNIGGYKVCYIGGFHQSFDFELVRKLSVELHDGNILLIGKETNEARKMLNRNNIVFLGWKHYTVLPLYMKHMDVFIIPYLLNERGKGVFPTKLFEYLYFRKPVVSIALPDILEYDKYLSVAHSKEEFVKSVRDSLSQGKNKLSSLDQGLFSQFMNANSWNSRYEEFKKCL